MAEPKFDPEVVAKYLADDSECPYCGGTDLCCAVRGIGDERRVNCENCGRHFVEVLKVADIYPIEREGD